MGTKNQQAAENRLLGAPKSIYRNSRDIVESEAVRETRRGDLTGAVRGVFHAGLAACALGADSAAEALPFVQRLAKETGEPGWLLANAAIQADSAPFLVALIELGLLDPLAETVWSGYCDQAGNFVRNLISTEEAVHQRAARCLSALLEWAPARGLLAKAVDSRGIGVFELLLSRAIEQKDLGEINEAFAALCERPNGGSWEKDKLTVPDMASKLLAAGAAPSFDAGSLAGWSSWNGSSPDKIARAWVPELFLAEEGCELPAGGGTDGSMDGAEFFSHWSSACKLARGAVEGGLGEKGAEALLSLPGWEMAAAPGSPLAPIALLAMANPSTTDSRLRRTLLPTHRLILDSPMLAEALRAKGPFSLAKAAIARWLWGSPAEPAATSSIKSWALGTVASTELINGLASACMELGERPLGPRGAAAAAQAFAGRMLLLDDSHYREPYKPATETAEQREARLAEQASREALDLRKERAAAASLAAFMPEAEAAMFLALVDGCHARGKIIDPHERAASKESLILGLLPTAPLSRRAMSL